MTQQIWLANLSAFSLQVAILVVAGSVLIHIFRLKTPAVLLTFWQVLLAVCLLLPAFQPWRQVPQPVAAPTQTTQPLTSFPVAYEPEATEMLSAAGSLRAAGYPLSAVVPYVLVGGIILRLLWLLLGLLRLQRYVDRSHRSVVLPESVREMQRTVGVAPAMFISPDIDSPVTVGWHRPAVLLPECFTAMSAGMQRTIMCHELLHVARRDWLFIVVEELLRSLFWFHPMIWWAVGRIRLSREQVVDRQVLRVTGERGPYLESLLQIASLRGRPLAVPAPLLLREHHLVHRVALMLKESKMTRSRLIASLAAIVSLLFWTGAYAVAWFPLIAAAAPDPAPALAISATPRPVAHPAAKEKSAAGAETQETAPTGSAIREPKLIDRVDPVYPELARRARVQQIVLLEALVDAAGNVASLRVMRGHPLLDQAAVDAVKQWHFEPGYQDGRPVPVKTNVEVAFKLDADSIPAGTSDAPTTVVAVRSGAAQAPAIQGGVTGGLPATAETSATTPQRQPLRVGGNVQESKILKRVDPVYPEVAKQARVEQIVMLEVTVNEEGYVTNVRVLRGHPLLDQAAIDAVKQWVYAPTLINGEKVPVIATVTIIFSLTPKYTLDADGYIKDSSGAIVSLAILREMRGPIQITPSAQTSFEQIQQTMGYLQTQGVENVRLNSQTYTYAAGRLFYLAPGTTTVPIPSTGGVFVSPVEIPRTADAAAQFIRSPILEIDWEQVTRIAETSGRLPSGASPPGVIAILYTVCVDEAGQIVAVQGPGGTLEMPQVTDALRAARVTRPGTRGNVPVPVAIRFSLRVTLK